MFVVWIVVFSLCVLDYYLIENRKVVIGKFQKDRKTINMTWHKVFDIIILLLVFLLITSNREGVDIINYHNWYVREQQTSREPLFTFLRIFAHQQGVSFYVFRALLTLACGLFPIRVFRKNSIPISYVMCLYMPIMLFVDSMQFRNSLALYIIIGATDYLLRDPTKFKNKCFFFFCVVIAAQLHTAFYCFLLFLFMCSKRKKLYGKLCFVGGILLLALSFFNNRTIPFINIVYNLIINGTDTRRYGYSGGNLIFIIPMTIHLFSILVLVYYARFYNVSRSKNGIFEKTYIDFINVVNFTFFIFVPLTMMNTTFYRFIRNMYMFDIISAYFMIRNINDRNKKICIFLFMFVIQLLWMFFIIGVYSNAEIIMDPILKNGDWFWK